MQIPKSLLTAFLVLCLLPTTPFLQAAPLHGIDATDLDRKADPCSDFYEFSNGAWRANNPIPVTMPRWSKRWASGEATKEQLRDILEQASEMKSVPEGSTEQIIGDYYGACMDEPRINARGIEVLKPWFAKIDGALDISGLQHSMADLHNVSVTVPFSLEASTDRHKTTWVLADLSASGFALPDRDYYLKPDPRFQEVRARYLEHIARMFLLTGWDEKAAATAAQTVMAMETKFAEASLDNATLRNPDATDHNTTFQQLTAMVPHIDWAEYLKHMHLPNDVDMNVEEPRYMQEIERQLQQTPLADWKTYLKWHVLHSSAEALSQLIVEENFAFFGKYLRGTPELKPRWKRCVESTDEYLGEALGRKYVEKHFPPEAKAKAEEMVRNLLLAMRDDILSRLWMSDETKERAMAKIATFNPKIGYPDKWKDYSKVTIRHNAFFEDYLAGRRFVVQDDLGTINKPVDRNRWGMTPPTSNAYYNPLWNEIVFPAGILQPPGFNIQAVDAVNYGSIGVVIGHEISHGFDDQGAKFDYQGRLRNWWTDSDLKQFQERGACVADQFEHYFIEPGVHHNGKLVLGESIGDLGGAKIAFLAFQKSLQGKPRPPDIDGFTPEQQFFIAWAQWRGDAIRIEEQRVMMLADPHPIGKFRVIGPLSNLPEFQKAFNCSADSPMVRPAANRCEVW